MLNYYSILKKEIIKNVNEYFSNQKSITKALETEISLFNINTFDLLLENMMTPEWQKQAIESIMVSLEMLSEDSANIESEYEKEIKATIKNSADKIVISNTSMDKEIKKDITKILQENPKANKIDLQNLITDKIDNDFLNRYPNRAKTIATTTSTQTIGYSQNKVSDKYKAEKRWLSMRDKRVRDGHEKADGQLADELGYFKVGGEELRYPGGGSNGGNNINCRCRIRLQKT